MKFVIFLFGCLFLLGCSSPKEFQKQQLIYHFYDNIPPSLCKKRTYNVNLPKGYEIENSQTEHFKGITCSKNDSLKFYFYNTIWDFPRFNEHNQVYSKIDPRIDISKDTTLHSGIQENGLHWKQKMFYEKNLVIGYINISTKEKEKFDKAIESLTLVKTRKCK